MPKQTSERSRLNWFEAHVSQWERIWKRREWLRWRELWLHQPRAGGFLKDSDWNLIRSEMRDLSRSGEEGGRGKQGGGGTQEGLREVREVFGQLFVNYLPIICQFERWERSFANFEPFWRVEKSWERLTLLQTAPYWEKTWSAKYLRFGSCI